MISSMMMALAHFADPRAILLLMLGVSIGVLFGALPGLGPTVALAVVLPFTYKPGIDGESFAVDCQVIGRCVVETPERQEGPAFRAEKHATTRHLNEISMLDAEMGFIESQYDVMDVFTRVIRHIVAHLEKSCAAEFKRR